MADGRRVLLVTYEFNPPSPEKREELDGILKADVGWAHYLAPTWLIVTDRSAHDFASTIIHLFKDADRLLVIEVKPGYQGWLPRRAWEWLHKNLPASK